MSASVKGHIAAALAALCGGTALPAAAQGELTAGLTAELTLLDMAGGAMREPQYDKPLRLRVQLRDVVTGKTPRGVELSGWIRQVDRFSRSCEEEAQAFRVTRSIAAGAIDLNGAVFSVLTEDANLGVIEPKLDGQPANMLAAASLGRMPTRLAIDRAGMRALAAFRDEGVVEGISLVNGAREVVDSRYDNPSAAIATASGQVWVAEDGSGRMVPLDGVDLSPVDVGSGGLLVSQPNARDNLIGAVSGQGGVVLFDGTTGHVRFRGNLGHRVSAAGFIADQGLLTIAGSAPTAELRYFGDFGRVTAIDLGFRAERLAVSPDSRIAVAYAPGSPALAIIDVATAQVVQKAALQDTGVAEVAFTDRAAFVATTDNAFVAVLDLNSVELGAPPVMRRVPMGGGDGGWRPDQRLLATMAPSPQMLVVDRRNRTGWVVPELAAVGNMPPDHSTRLGGGVPLQVDVVDRSFRETAPGRYETVARIGKGGRHELVLTTGIGGLTRCFPFTVGGPEQDARKLFTLSLAGESGEFRSGRDEVLVFSFADEEGRPLDVEAADFIVPNLQSGWSTQIRARRDMDGRLKATVRFPHPGAFVIQPLGAPSGWMLKSSVLIEVGL